MNNNLSEAKQEEGFVNRLNINNALEFIREYNAILIFFTLVLVGSIISDSFFTERNIFNVLRQVAGLGIISMGMLMVILTGGIDLSVGSVLAFASVGVAYFLQSMPLPLALISTITIGGLIGAVSGYFVSAKKIAPFVVTLAFMTIARGFAFMLSKGAPIMTDNNTLLTFGSGYFLKIPYPVFLMLGIFIIIYGILKYTSFGRIVKAIGSNEECVRLSGITVKYYKLSVYVFSGAFAALGGIISTSRTGVGSPIVGTGYELDAIAAVVIGGASLNGGKGTAINTLMGVFILGVIGNIMNLMNIPSYPQQVIKGVIIIMAVFFQRSKAKSAS